ncbi:Gfo/Idh/MocA family protein [Paenibacillus sp. strain BS8-2]
MSQYHVVVVGCGNMSNAWIEYANSREDIRIVGLVDLFLDSARNAKLRHGLDCDVFTNVEEAIKETQANVVFNVTAPDAHFEVCRTAMMLGCHVLGEKPLAATMDEALALVQLANESEVTYSVMQNRRFDRNIRAYRDLLHSGAIGAIGHVGADFFMAAHFGGFRDAMESPLILDMAIHTFDSARFLTGADAVSVYCQEFNPKGSWYQGHAMAVCIFEMSDGSVFSYRGSWCSEGMPTSWQSNWRVSGEKGTALWDGEQYIQAEAVRNIDQTGKFTYETERVEAAYHWKGEEGHRGCLDEMFLALEQKRSAETDCRDNIKSMAMVLGAIESARTGVKVQLNI